MRKEKGFSGTSLGQTLMPESITWVPMERERRVGIGSGGVGGLVKRVLVISGSEISLVTSL